MRVPVSIPICGIDIKVEWVEKVMYGDEEDQGSSNHLLRVISISKNGIPNTPENIKSTLLHEMFHMALGLTGHSDRMNSARKEEALVVALETALAPHLCIDPNNKRIKWRDVHFPWEEDK